MENTYNGTVSTKVEAETKDSNGLALLSWVCSLLISLLPIWMLLLQYYNLNGKIDRTFWIQCFVSEDILWVVATVLLFSAINSGVKAKRRGKKFFGVLTMLGITVFVFIEGLWVFFEYIADPKPTGIWTVNVGVIFSAIAILIAAPLQLEFNPKRR